MDSEDLLESLNPLTATPNLLTDCPADMELGEQTSGALTPSAELMELQDQSEQAAPGKGSGSKRSPPSTDTCTSESAAGVSNELKDEEAVRKTEVKDLKEVSPEMTQEPGTEGEAPAAQDAKIPPEETSASSLVPSDPDAAGSAANGTLSADGQDETKADAVVGELMETDRSLSPERKTSNAASPKGADDKMEEEEAAETKEENAAKSSPVHRSGPKGGPVTELLSDSSQELKRSDRPRRSDTMKAESLESSGEVPLSDEDSDAMVDDPKDEDFVPSRPRRSTRMSLKAQTAQRAGRPSITKMMCANCRTPLQKGQTAYQRKGLPQLFCSSNCLTTFSKKPAARKICTFCKKEIWSTRDLVVAQTGVGGSFQEFCNSACLSLHEAQIQRPASHALASVTSGGSTDAARCSVCHKTGEIQHEVSNGNVVHRICSDVCFTKFRATKGLKTNCCDNCGIYIYNKGLPLEYLYHEGQQKRFCNSSCLNAYKKKNTKVYPCLWCKTLCKNFEMLSNVDRSGKMGLFCSVCCITSHKVKQSGPIGPVRPCGFCRRTLSTPVYYNKIDRAIYQFCSSSCWTNFQQSSPEGGVHLNCHYCHNLFSGKPETLEWQDAVHHFCCKECCEDYKRLHGVVSVCEYCRQEKLLHEKIKFSGVEKNFCSEGCVLLYKQDFTKNLGLCCITCTYCSQTCQRAVTEELDGNTWDFCSEDCKSKYLLWYFKAARCHACKRQGKLLETIHWRGEIKHFCNQQCLLRFYNQQNQPNLDTQKGPESLLNSQAQDSKAATPTSQKFDVSMMSLVGLFGVISSKSRSAQRSSSPHPPPTPPQPAPTTIRKNKAAMCKPLMQNRGVSCRIDTKSKGCQTEEDWKPQVIVLPVPVPIFVPLPLHMYCQKTPVPFSMPIPIPVPMFLPTTLESADKIVETIEELKVKIPSNPLEADILAMAEMIAEAEEMEKSDANALDLASNQSAEGLLEDCDLFGPARDDVLAMAVKMANVLDEPGQDLEADFPKTPLDLNPSVDFLFDCGLVTPDEVHAEQDIPRAVRKGQKRLVLSESCSRDSMGSQPGCAGLNYSYGVNAWKYWVQGKYAGGHSDKGEELRFGPKPMRMKEDILSCTAAELNYGLAQFVKEITRPNGERYEPDSIYYLCLGIQQYLLENNRMVNIFTDLYYLTFVQELNKALSGWQPALLPNGMIFSRVEEEHLWECKQLGVYSPFVLLNTLMFFNTKYFGLRSPEDHMHLSFANVVRQSRKCTTSRGVSRVVSIRYYAPARHKKGRESGGGKRKRDEEVCILEQQENRMNPLRCPVKFYEFYLSKCPESMRNRNDVFYLQPERSCVAESPLWYSVIPMDRSMLESMLNRILAVREIYEDHAHGGIEDDVD
uniref:Zinc finger MYM-type containing 3 n=1 Tax=Latimeria chalumnae TaxID=7897 RepID=H2ZZK5_LATCH